MANEKDSRNLQNADPGKTGDSDSSSSKSGFDPKSLRFLKPVIPTGVIAAVVIGSLAGYQAPTYTAKAASAASDSSNTKASKEKDASGSEKNSAKTSAKKLPAVSTVSESGSSSSSAASSSASSSGSGTAKKLSKVSDKNKTYKDGTYTGSAQGFGGPIKVRVTIKNGKIASVVITSHEKETPAFFNKAKVLAKTIQSKQTTNVDAVSGATYSSNGIINAVRNALAKAGGSSSSSSVKAAKTVSGKTGTTKKKNTSSNAGKKAPKRKKKAAASDTTYKDGTYTGTGTGFGGPIKVKVVIKNGKIQSVTVTDHSGETEPFYSNASVLTQTIVEKQSTNVDAVSGATFSSNGILDAVDAALQKAAVKNSSNSTKKSTTDNSKKNSGTSDSDNTKKNTNTSGSDDDNKKTNTSDSDNTKNNSSNQNTSTDDDNKKTDTGDTGTVYTPGTYTVSSMVYPDEDEDFIEYEITLDVTIADDKITEITNVKNTDSDTTNAAYLRMAANGLGSRKGVVKQIVEAGNADSVDAVSGATCSSEGIISGVKSALQKALKTNTAVTDNSATETAAETESASASSETSGQTVETATLTASSVSVSAFRFTVPGSREINTSRLYRLNIG